MKTRDQRPKTKDQNKKGQSTIEFTFTLIVIFFLAYGLIRVFRWVGLDMAERRWAQEQSITLNGTSAEQQLAPDFYRPKRLHVSFKDGQ